MKITIKGKEVELKNKMRAFMIYEEILDKPFAPKTLFEIMMYFYSVVMANCKELQLTFDEFLDYLDEHPQLSQDFKKWIAEENDKMGQFKKSGDSKKK